MATQVKIRDDGKIMLTDVRLAFPSLFKPANFQGQATDKYSATFLLPKSDEEGTKLLKQVIAKAIKSAGITQKIPPDKLFMRDGDELPYDGFEGNWSLKASSQYKPTVVDRKRQPVIAGDGLIYPGCFVIAIIEPWVQDNQFGKRVNATVTGVQFYKEGDPFVGGRPAEADEFDELDPSDMEEVF